MSFATRKTEFLLCLPKGYQNLSTKKAPSPSDEKKNSRVCVECIATTGSRRALVGWLQVGCHLDARILVGKSPSFLIFSVKNHSKS